MNPQQFVEKWKLVELKERSAAQEHFIDLCQMLGQPTPAEADPKGAWYCFEAGATKTGGGDGWADVWRRAYFGWEYKGKKKNLDVALKQLQLYAPALENPPLLVVSDMDRIRIHTNWTNTVSRTYDIPLNVLTEPGNVQILKWVFTEPERLRPGVTTTQVTEQAAHKFASLAERLRSRGHAPERVAHFLNRLMFCLFAEDATLLPTKIVSEALTLASQTPEFAESALRQLFGAMNKGGFAGYKQIDWFNGGLFNSDEALPLLKLDIEGLLEAAALDWAAVEPSIFGTLFERGLDPSKRSQLGAHYTDATSILRIIGPVIIEPLIDQWTATKERIVATLARADKAKTEKTNKKLWADADKELQTFMQHLSEFSVLDPACGSGNFLYLALQSLKDLELRVALEAEQMGLDRDFTGMNVGVHCVHGIEVNNYAAELARVTVWIGEIQWMLKHGVPPSKNPILKPLDTIECRDAVLNSDGTEAFWPAASVIIGNPPFLGDKKMRDGLGAPYIAQLRSCYAGRVPGGADLVTYWFEKARHQIETGESLRAGLVGTNSIRGGANRQVLDRIAATTNIYEAWSNEEWVNDGAQVHVSLVCFGDRPIGDLDGKSVPSIYTDLTAGHDVSTEASADLTCVPRLSDNVQMSFSGIQKTGPFEIPGAMARSWLLAHNPGGKSNADVVKPWSNGLDVVRRNRDMWIVDFGVDLPEAEAALYEIPFEYVKEHVKPTRVGKREERTNEMWWIFQWSRPFMRKALAGKARFIVTPEVSKHRIFAWLEPPTVPDKNLVVIASESDAVFGVLHSRFHELWALRLGTSLEDRPRYTSSTTFDTFPFPDGLSVQSADTEMTNSHAKAVGKAAIDLCHLRGSWLNPSSLTQTIPGGAGYPERVIAQVGAEDAVSKLTLTNLYNTYPTWLAHAHERLDVAVAAAYGWNDYSPQLSDSDLIRRLLSISELRAPA